MEKSSEKYFVKQTVDIKRLFLLEEASNIKKISLHILFT